jgi:putative redox protein
VATIKHVTVDSKQVNGFTIEAQARNHKVIIDQPEAGGGQNCGPNPLEYLFFSLAGCIITIGHIIAKQRRLPVRSIQVRVVGDLDTDVLMGKSTAERAGFTNIRVITSIDADMTQAEKEQFLKDIDARCPISDNIHNLSPIELVVEEVAIAA